ncbi:MAG: RsmB/NOP family class I SAM-dependent RNA methyltransferase [Calditrichaeota bacterium]|nr:RsmB/NOP family class I SAM-dependent RNA methyltransferase [Calditrichota bacterium]
MERENKFLKKYLKDFLGDQITDFWDAKPEPRAIRVNTLRTTTEQIKERLKELGVKFRPVPFNPDGLIIDEDHLPLSQTIDFYLGKFYYQGVSSQLPALALNPQPGDKVLDMTASPGSKSTQIAALMRNKGFLVLNDVSMKRLQALNTNIQKVGAVNYAVYRQPGERIGNILPEYFDKVLLDAPCTALGIIHSHPEVYSWLTYRRMQKIIEKQRQLLVSAFKALKVGGELVYSTCSIAPEENEELIQFMLDHYPLEIMEIDPGLRESFLPGLTEYNNKAYVPEMTNAVRILPHIHNMEGFFVIKLLKTGRRHSGHNNFRTFQTLPADSPEIKDDLLQISEQWGIPADLWRDYRYIKTRNRIWMVNTLIKKIPQEGFLNAGLLLGEKRISGWKLPNDSILFFGKRITKRHLGLNEEQLRELFRVGMITLPEAEDGYFALSWKGEAIGSLYVSNRRAKIRLMHRFNVIL